VKSILTIILAIFLFSCSVSSNKLEEKEQTIELGYISWACACANWATPEDMVTYQDTGKLSEHCLFIEPAHTGLKLADTLGYTGDLIRFKGRFYINKGITEEFKNIEGPVEKARIFRYTGFEIIRSNYKDTRHSNP
jgi:hypothetical protein